jgi:lipopolysaccharide/colanic/teichoic acid biosynthesis glycosyltransferase
MAFGSSSYPFNPEPGAFATARARWAGKLEAHRSALSGTKRLLDIVGALVGLSLTLLLLPLIATAIWLDAPGPLFFSQMRCGLRGEPFRIWKFRSMQVGAETRQHLVQNQASGHVFKNDRDPRVTQVGQFLRRTSLDELPQFWNVLRGEMSLVGTRPPTLTEVANYTPHHWQRLRVRPGITGEWQVQGRSAISDFERIVAMDVSYQEKWSILYDITLILKTFAVVITRRGAY